MQEHAPSAGTGSSVDVPAPASSPTPTARSSRQILQQPRRQRGQVLARGRDGSDRRRASPRRVELRVSDEGIGIPRAEQQRIFSKFYRAESHRAGRQGTGLGLFLVRGLVAAMGGRISVESIEGKGSTFAFELPVASDRGDECSRPETGGDGGMALTVLVIDDEAPIRLLCRVNLEAEGMEVLEAPTTGRARAGERERPDAILLDVMMPGLDGWTVAEELLEDEATAPDPDRLPHRAADLRDRARGLDLGGLDYITKPFNPVELASLVDEVVEAVERGERDELRAEKLAELRDLLGRRRPGSPGPRAVCASTMAARTRRPPTICPAELLAEPGVGDDPGEDRLEHRDTVARVAGMWRSALTMKMNGTTVPSTTMQAIRSQTGRVTSSSRPSREASLVEVAVGKAPPRLNDRPEERREEEAPGEERVDVAAAADAVLGHQDVERVGEGAASAAATPTASSVPPPLQISATSVSPPRRARARTRAAAEPARGRRSAPRGRPGPGRGTG